MHCPTCREDNAPTTRFCTSCGAVLVEEAPGGGRRRVLRPWGLRKSAPLTVSPDLPDAAAAPSLAEVGAWRTDLWLAGAIGAIVVLVATLHPWFRRADSEPASRVAERVVVAPAVVSAPAPALVRETRLVAPALVERTTDRTRESVPAEATPSLPAVPAPRWGGVRVPAVPVTYAMPPREAVIGDGQSSEVAATTVAATPAPATPAPDRWQVLRADLDSCQPLGVLDRAMCEQRARLTHCEGYWGHATLCPARAESGQ